MTIKLPYILFFIVTIFYQYHAISGHLPDGFVYLDELKGGEDIQVSLCFITEDNFVGEKINGYEINRAILTETAANAIIKVNQALKKEGLQLKIMDAYRPQRAVDAFIEWAKDLNDTKTKSRHYPDVQKNKLFKEGYIAEKSSHTRGSTVDLTIIDSDGYELDMGCHIDFFGLEAWPSSTLVSPDQKENRMLLQSIMIKHGFTPLKQEWWHFTLKDEPFKDSYFDFVVE